MKKNIGEDKEKRLSKINKKNEVEENNKETSLKESDYSNSFKQLHKELLDDNTDYLIEESKEIDIDN